MSKRRKPSSGFLGDLITQAQESKEDKQGVNKNSSLESIRELISSYDEIYETKPLRESEEHYRWVLEKLNPPQETTLLDIACGGGYFLRQAEKKSLRTIGLDFSASALKIARQEAKNSALICGNAEELPFRGETFDFISNLGSLEHFINPKRAVEEMARVLKKKGRAAILVPNSYFLMTIINVWRTGSTGRRTDQKIDRWASKEEWSRLIEQNGFRIETVYKYNYKTPADSWKYRLIRPFIPLNLSYCFLFICSKP